MVEILMDEVKQKLFSQFPQVDQILQHSQLQSYLSKFSHEFVLKSVQTTVDHIKSELLQKEASNDVSRKSLEQKIVNGSLEKMQRILQPSLQRAINCTGIILHTGLGRAPLIKEAKDNIAKVAEGYCNLELDLDSGKRGERGFHVEELLCYLTGAEAACVVNNNAAAVLLSLNTLCFGKEAVISRGQLIEIGGSFRIPEVMEKSGAKMVEVGTTNKTHLKDYEKAISKNTGLICVVHPSNYRVKGFTADVSLLELVKLAAKHNIPVIQDLGGGVLIDLRKYGLPYEPVAKESVELGLDVVTFSGDKVLGGPQAGIIVGKKKYVDQIKSNPLMRALRCDKLIYAALEPTLKLYLKEEELLNRNRVLKMVLEPLDTINRRAIDLKSKLSSVVKGCQIKVEDTCVEIGSGALPLEELPSKAISLRSDAISTEMLAQKFRTQTPPIIGYIRDDRLFFDMRTIFEDERDMLLTACINILTNESA